MQKSFARWERWGEKEGAERGRKETPRKKRGSLALHFSGEAAEEMEARSRKGEGKKKKRVRWMERRGTFLSSPDFY